MWAEGRYELLIIIHNINYVTLRVKRIKLKFSISDFLYVLAFTYRFYVQTIQQQ